MHKYFWSQPLLTKTLWYKGSDLQDHMFYSLKDIDILKWI